MDIDKLMLQVPELPRDFEQWVRNVPLSDSKYMFTFRDGQGGRKGYCTHCEKIVDLDYRNRRTTDSRDFENCLLKHNDIGFCPECKSTVIFKDNGRGKGRLWSSAKVIVLQRIGNTACFRYFDVMRNFRECDLTPVETQITEEYRLFMDPGEHKVKMMKRNIEYGSDWSWLYYGFDHGEAYIRSPWYEMSRVNTELTAYGAAYLYNIDSITDMFKDTSFKYCCLDEYLKATKDQYCYRNVIKHLTTYCRYPNVTEYLIKCGFVKLYLDSLRFSSYSVLNMRAKKPEKLFKLTKVHIKYFKEKEQSIRNLQYLQALEKDGHGESELHLFFENVDKHIYENSWRQILKYTTQKKAQNYVIKQHSGTLLPVSDYADYLRDCEKLGYSLTESCILFPKNLAAAHDRTRALITARERAQRRANEKKQRKETAGKNALMNREINKMYPKLCEKYEFHSGGLFVRPAKSVKEIKDEGKRQRICVGDDNQSYIKNYAGGAAYICFIRKEADPDTPFYTVEITNNQHICQVRGFKNSGQTPLIQAFVKQWESYLSRQSK